MKFDPPHAGSVLISQRLHLARIPHSCDRCGKLIEPSELYLREAYRKIDSSDNVVRTWSFTLHRQHTAREPQQAAG